jgi:hypothetical protein
MTTFRIRRNPDGPEPGDHLLCPVCDRLEEISLEDPDASLAEMISHIRIVHPNVDMTPDVLWPRIEVVTDVKG